ncbi:MAG: aldo/keto reductase, partial [Dehalococcoidia bacterium]|nr:aldo/keto reductase [Dehalococcoidia bacterium]
MKKNMLGKTGLEVSRLGIGLSEIGFNFTSNDFSMAEKVLNVALDEGINFLDTAACYGISEETIGLAVAHRRSDYVLATKAGHYLPRGEGEDWTYELITKSIERSLLRLKTDYLDLVQLHSCDTSVLEKGEVIRSLLDAKAAGKV